MLNRPCGDTAARTQAYGEALITTATKKARAPPSERHS